MALDFDLNFNFVSDESMKAYLLGGGHYSVFKAEFDDEEGSEGGIGFHFGAGARFDNFFLEGKYNLETTIWEETGFELKQPGQVVVTVGYIF